MMPPDHLKLRVLEAARRQPAPHRIDGLPAIAVPVLAAAAMAAVLYGVPPLFGEVGGVAHATGRPLASGAWIVGGTLAMAVLATWLVLPGRRSMLSPPRGVLVAIAVGAPVLVGAWLMAWHGTYEDPFTRFGWRCFTLTALTAPWPFAALVHASRRIDPTHPATTGAALGAVAGAWAAVMVELWCPLSAHAHVVVGHVAPVVAFTLVGAVFGAWMFRLRASARTVSGRA